MLRQHIVFNGWVQGVGFRYRASHAAAYYGATGWVRNEFDGSVTEKEKILWLNHAKGVPGVWYSFFLHR